MDIETELTDTSNDISRVYESIGDIGDHRQDLQTLNDVNKDQLKSGHDFENNLRDISAFDNRQSLIHNSIVSPMKANELCVSPQKDEDMDSGIGAPVSTGRDRFCWVCHKDRTNLQCKQCPRSYHLKCIPQSNPTNSTNSDIKSKLNSKCFESWICIECKDIIADEDDLHQTSSVTDDDNTNTSVQSTYGPKWRLAQMSTEELSQLFKFALQTIRQSADPTFHKPVSPIVFPDYHQLVQYPMDLSTIERNIKNNKYRSQTSFLADIKWIVHNCIIYNHNNHPLSTNAKYLCRVARNEMAEMEICPDCFKNFYTVTEMSFAEPCRRPHQLVFARVKGYPLWPAKVVRLGKQNEVDCRFFGTHDRAWVAVDACWLVSEVHPGSKPNKTHKSKFEGAMRELSVHIDRMNAKFNDQFKYSPQKTPFSPKQIFILEEDNEMYNKMVSEMQSKEENALKSDSDDSKLSNNGITNSETKSNDKNSESADERVSNSSKSVVPGVFSLSSDKVLDEFKPELSISTESSNLLNKSIKTNCQIKEDLNSKARTARVGKRNVAEALRASKVQRTAGSTSASQSLLASQKAQSLTNTSNNSVSNPIVSTPKVKGISTGGISQQSLTGQNNLREQLEQLRKQLSFDNAMHREEIREVKHNADLVLMEMRQSWVTERDKALSDERQKHDLERKLMIAQFENERKKMLANIEEAKRKQWCAECLKEAQLFCCYDTWYCTYECQKAHWKSHVNVCQQIHKKS